eukprot:gene6627-3283_t
MEDQGRYGEPILTADSDQQEEQLAPEAASIDDEELLALASIDPSNPHSAHPADTIGQSSENQVAGESEQRWQQVSMVPSSAHGDDELLALASIDPSQHQGAGPSESEQPAPPPAPAAKEKAYGATQGEAGSEPAAWGLVMSEVNDSQLLAMLESQPASVAAPASFLRESEVDDDHLIALACTQPVSQTAVEAGRQPPPASFLRESEVDDDHLIALACTQPASQTAVDAGLQPPPASFLRESEVDDDHLIALACTQPASQTAVEASREPHPAFPLRESEVNDDYLIGLACTQPESQPALYPARAAAPAPPVRPAPPRVEQMQEQPPLMDDLDDSLDDYFAAQEGAPDMEDADLDDYFAAQEEEEEAAAVAAAAGSGAARSGAGPSKQAGGSGVRPREPSTSAATALNEPSNKRSRVTAAPAGVSADDMDFDLPSMAHLLPSDDHATGPNGLYDIQLPSAPPPDPYRNLPRLLASDIEGDCLTVTATGTGVRAYCKMGPTEGQLALSSAAGGIRMNLLSRPISDMIRDVEEERIRAAVADSKRLAQESSAAAAASEAWLANGGEGSSVMTAMDLEELGHRHQPQVPTKPVEDALWVNKYSPRSFMSLLSDEATNRAVAKTVAKWVKEWDQVVFGIAKPSIGPQGLGGAGLDHRGRGGWVDSRPENKVVLIAGPPGLGKTTLAHVLAKHCGYHPYEINASDDRSATALTNRIQDAVQMQSVLGQRQPNLVVIDEIDGATGGAEGVSAISALLKIVNAGPGSRTYGRRAEGCGCGRKQEGDGGRVWGAGRTGEWEGVGGAEGVGAISALLKVENAGPGSRANGDADVDEDAAEGGVAKVVKKKKSSRPLMRPIICICNDLYAPALRPLREVAKVIHFKFICEKEKVKADKQALQALADRTDSVIRSCLNTLQFLALQALADRTDCDIRACLNTLQFMAKQHAEITTKAVERMNIGTKDMTRNAFSIWTDILQTFWEQDLVLNGIHENLLHVKFLDINMRRTSSMMDRLAETESMMV